MPTDFFLYSHLATIVPALVSGPFILWRKKGDSLHRWSGRIWASLMIVSSLLSFGVQYNDRLSWLHGLSAVTIVSVGIGVHMARTGRIEQHKRYMRGPLIGMWIAFFFTLHPERMLGKLFGSLF
ncbi:MAG: hypothetical protein V4760_01570 [Bdellovibrionota bacterium]